MDKDEQKTYFASKYADIVTLWTIDVLVSITLEVETIIKLTFSKQLSPHEVSHVYLPVGIIGLFLIIPSIIGLIYYYRQTKKDNLQTTLFWKKVGKTILLISFLLIIFVLAHIFHLD